MKSVLSFDQAAIISGWSYWEDEKLVDKGIINSSPRKDGKRLTYLKNAFGALIDKYNPDQILIENPVGGEEDKFSGPENNWKTMQVLCQVQGVLLQTIDEKGKPVEIISPSSWQNTCGIHKRSRAERKAGAREFVEKIYGLSQDKISQDEVDSICIAYHYFTAAHQDRFERSVF